MVNNVYDLITRTMEQEFPGRVAFRWVEDATGTVKEKTYAEYAQDIRRAAAWFARNIPEVEGKRVVLLSRNCYEYGVNTFGAVLAGAVLVTMNQKKTWDELSWELELAEPALILSDGVDYGCRDQLEAAYGERLRPMDVWKDTAPGGLEKKIDPNALMVMLFTSGTTGRSKAVMLAERNFFTVMQMHVAMGDHMLDFKHRQLPEDKNDVLSNFAILPLFHLGTFICLFSWPFKGWALNLCSDLRNFYRDLGLMHSDSIAVAPVLMESIYKDVKRGRADKLNGLWNPCGSSAMFDSEMLLSLVKNGMYITQCYGMTETCGDGLVNYAQAEPHIRALGKPDGHCEYKLDETGEICIRGGCVMLGYYKDPEATAEIIDKDGWLHTGDLAREDEDGYYYMVGRKKNLIILGTGENVSPEELEKKLNACPGAGVRGQGDGQKDRRADLLCRGKAGRGPGFPHRAEPYPAAVPADHGSGVQRRTPAPQRHGQAAAQVSAEIAKKARNRAACVLHFLYKTGIIKHRNVPPGWLNRPGAWHTETAPLQAIKNPSRKGRFFDGKSRNRVSDPGNSGGCGRDLARGCQRRQRDDG